MKKPFTILPLLIFTFFYGSSQTSSPIQRLRTNLYGVNANGTKSLIDGTLSEFSATYSSGLDGMDARKLINYGLNISILRGTTNLVIERRNTIASADTIPFKIWGTQKRTYQFELVTTAFDPSLSCVLEDKYLHTLTPVQFADTTNVIFTINNDPASAVTDRFSIIFKQVSQPVLPLVFTSFNAINENNQVMVDWKTENEGTVQQYVVERSFDGKVFTDFATVDPTNLVSNSYEWIDHYPGLKNNYYRIRSLEAGGKTAYSDVVKVFFNTQVPHINIFPNPASAANLNLQMTNQPAGNYEILLTNYFNQAVMSKTIQFNGTNGIIDIHPGKGVPKGIYLLQIIAPNGDKQFMNVVF